MLLFQLTVKIFLTIIFFTMLMSPILYFYLTLHQIIKHVNIFTKKTAMFIILPEVILFLFLFGQLGKITSKGTNSIKCE